MNVGASHVQELKPDTLGHGLVMGAVPKGCAAHLPYLFDEASAPMLVTAAEADAAKKGVALNSVWRGVAKLAKSLTVHRHPCGQDDSVMKSLPADRGRQVWMCVLRVSPVSVTCHPVRSLFAVILLAACGRT